MQNALNKNL